MCRRNFLSTARYHQQFVKKILNYCKQYEGYLRSFIPTEQLSKKRWDRLLSLRDAMCESVNWILDRFDSAWNYTYDHFQPSAFYVAETLRW